MTTTKSRFIAPDGSPVRTVMLTRDGEQLVPFATRAEAAYWGGGAVAEDMSGGYWSLHFQSHPNGWDLSTNGKNGGAPGWPDSLTKKHVVDYPAYGAQFRCVCVVE